IRAANAILLLPLRSPRLDGALETAPDAFDVVLMDALEPPLQVVLLAARRVAKTGQAAIPEDDTGLEIPVPDGLARGLQDHAIAVRGAVGVLDALVLTFGGGALDRDARQMRREVDEAEVHRRRRERLSMVHGEGAEHLAGAGQDRRRPTGSEAAVEGHIA